MNHDELEEAFRRTLDDRRLTRGERRALTEIVDELDPAPGERAILLGRAFEVAADALSRHADREVLDWLLGVARIVALPPSARSPHDTEIAEACFGPCENCSLRLRMLIAESSSSLDVCVFTITDNALAEALLAAHGRGLNVRVITDDLTSLDPGSDVFRLRDAGVAVRFDGRPEHMHHKFAVFDRRLLVTGSYNWTRTAARHNHENILITDQKPLVSAFLGEFERLWNDFPAGPPETALPVL